MSCRPGSISPQEKEKLRKRLQKLFQEFEESEAAGSSSKSSKKKNQQNKKDFDKQDNTMVGIKGQQQHNSNSNKKKQQMKKQNTTTTNFKNSEKQQQQETQKKKSSFKVGEGTATKQNGFIKKAKNKTTKEDSSNKKGQLLSKKSQQKNDGVNDKTKQKGSSSSTTKTNEASRQQQAKSDFSPSTKPTLPKVVETTKKLNGNIPQKVKNNHKQQSNQQKNAKLHNQQKNPKKISIEEKTEKSPPNSNTKKQKQQENVNKTSPVVTAPKSISKLNKNQNKKAQKRIAPEDTSSSTAVNKKPKLTKNKAKEQKVNKTITNKKKINKTKRTKNKSKNLHHQLEDEPAEFDINGMTGCVRGGDFDSDYNEDDDEEYNYWMQQENYSSNEDEQQTKEESPTKDNKKSLEKFKKSSGKEMQHFNGQYDESDSEEDYYDSDDDEDAHEFYDDFDDYDDEEEEEEEEEYYSDFDEDDYEEDEDSFDYGMDSDDDYSSNYDEEEDDYGNDSSYEFDHHGDDSEDDEDYQLPKHVPEDLIVHSGTATKRDLKPEDNVSFNSENEDAQIIELEEQATVKVIEQPTAYKKEELIKLKYKVNTPKPITFHRRENTSNATVKVNEPEEDECPKLVPIVDEDGFQLYNPNEESEEEEENLDKEQEDDSMEEELYDDDMEEEISLGSEYEEVNSEDADSLISEDINEKYLNRGQREYDSDVQSIDEDVWQRKYKVDVIDATGFKYEQKTTDSKNESDVEMNDDIKQIPSIKLFKNVNLKTGSSILSTTVIDNKNFKEKVVKEDKTKAKQREEPNEATKSVANHPETAVKETQTLDFNELQDQMDIDSATENVEQEKLIKPLAEYYTKFFNALASNMVLVLLKDPFYVYGTVRLTLLAGAVEVYGHSLQLNAEVEIFSPRGCSVIEIAPSANKNTAPTEDLKELLKSYEKHFALDDLRTITDLFNPETDAVLLLQRNEARKKLVQQFKKFMNENVFPNINNINIDRPLYNTEYLLRCIINSSAQEQKCLRLSKQWKQLHLTTNSRIMLTGGKGVGKSTLLRYLINRHLPKQPEILLIDLDIGQPEVFMPQTVSCTKIKQPLLGPGFMLNLHPDVAYAVGHTNIALCAHKYMSALQKLIAFCKSQEEYQNIPWLINTMGYNKGFGLELISAIAKELPLTDVIQLQSSKDINNFDSILHDHVLTNVPRLMFADFNNTENERSDNLKYRLHVWQSAVEQESRYQKEWEMSAKDMRFAILLARLSEALQGHADWLTDIKPLSASLNELKIVNLLDDTCGNTAEELSKSVEANLVYLCHYEKDFEPLKCFGIGVVRAVDLHIQQLYLIPAVAHSQLKEVNCVALGEMPLPTSLFTNQGSKVKNIAPFVYNTVAANASKAIKQIYHRPRKFLSGKHKSLD
ncbi:uncharacterized protein ACRADG_009585 [Cochliomyia hominivorax]